MDIKTGDAISVKRYGGAHLTGTVAEVGDWIKSCAGTPMRWVVFVDARGARSTVADTPFNDSQIAVLA